MVSMTAPTVAAQAQLCRCGQPGSGDVGWVWLAGVDDVGGVRGGENQTQGKRDCCPGGDDEYGKPVGQACGVSHDGWAGLWSWSERELPRLLSKGEESETCLGAH